MAPSWSVPAATTWLTWSTSPATTAASAWRPYDPSDSTEEVSVSRWSVASSSRADAASSAAHVSSGRAAVAGTWFIAATTPAPPSAMSTATASHTTADRIRLTACTAGA